MRARLRRLLDLIVEPHIPGRHTPDVPVPTRLDGFSVEQWANDTWATIARRHGIEDDQ